MPSSTPFCPLCFEPLTEEHHLQVARLAEMQARESVTCSLENLEAIVREDQKGDFYPNGLFVAHAQCSRYNPFYDPARQGIYFCREGEDPGRFNSGRAVIPDSGVEVNHPQIGHLKTLQLRFPKVHQMWFPAALIAAALGKDSKWQSGRVVVLAGARGVGKTILSQQAMHRGGFVNRLNMEKMEVRAQPFAYSPNGARFAEMLNNLTKFRQPEAAIDAWTPEPTPPDIGDLRAIFYEAAKVRPAARRKEDNEVAEVRHLFGTHLFRRAKKPEERVKTVIFYDAAGEHYEARGQESMRLLEVAHHIGVMIPAPSLLPHTGTEQEIRALDRSLLVACEHIPIFGRLPDPDTTWSIVVSKTDEVRSRTAAIREKLWTELEEAAEMRKEYAASGVALSRVDPLNLIGELLGARPDRRHREFLNCINGARRPPEAFFIWTEDLPQDAGALPPAGVRRSGAALPAQRLPVSFGLGNFIACCLGESLDTINIMMRTWT